ncbi:MAG: DUF433 domain-containing protein [Planctomycetota bacterium]
MHERISIDPTVLCGKPVIRGTRLAVEFIVDLLGNGWTEEQILGEYPGIIQDDIRACLRFASATLREESEKTVGDNLHGFRSNSSTLIYEEESGDVLKTV